MDTEQIRVTRGMVFVARAIDAAGMSWYAAAKKAGLNSAHVGRVLTGRRGAGTDTIAKFRDTFGVDANLWLEEARHDEREDWKRLLASMLQRRIDAVSGRAAA